MNSSGIRFLCLLLAGASILLGSTLIARSYSRLNLSMGSGASIHVAEMEMVAGAVLIAGGLISMSVLASSSSPKRGADEH